jgi:hypothetical protein
MTVHVYIAVIKTESMGNSTKHGPHFLSDLHLRHTILFLILKFIYNQVCVCV